VPDVLYVHPARHAVDAGHQDLGFYFFMPVGIIALANLLRHEGLTVRGINYPAELLRDPKFRLKPWLRDQEGVRLVMVDLHWFEHSYGAISVARACRQVLPDVPVLLGGMTASFFAAEILRSFPDVSFVIRGDAEEPLRRLIAELARPTPELSSVPNLSYRLNGQVVENDLAYCATSEDLDDLDFVDLGFLEHADSYGMLQFEPTDLSRSLDGARGHWLCIGRGCAFDCSFCGGGRESHRILSGRQSITLRSVARVAQDIQRLEQEGVSQVSPNLDPAILGTEYWRSLFAELRRQQVHIGINNEHFQLPSREFIQDFAQTVDIACSEVALTLLSGSDKVRRLNGKCYTNKQLFSTLSALKEAGVPLYIYFSLNLPGEDERTFRETMHVARQIGQIYPSTLLKIINQAHTIDPCCPMSREPGPLSVHVETRDFLDYYNYCRMTLDIRPGEVAPCYQRGFTFRGEQNRSLELMVRQWNEFCARQDFLCFRVPQSW
jgi:radical SAM superfamily enzyme YgiQ (UPF0313 family)